MDALITVVTWKHLNVAYPNATGRGEYDTLCIHLYIYINAE